VTHKAVATQARAGPAVNADYLFLGAGILPPMSPTLIDMMDVTADLPKPAADPHRPQRGLRRGRM